MVALPLAIPQSQRGVGTSGTPIFLRRRGLSSGGTTGAGRRANRKRAPCQTMWSYACGFARCPIPATPAPASAGCGPPKTSFRPRRRQRPRSPFASGRFRWRPGFFPARIPDAAPSMPCRKSSGGVRGRARPRVVRRPRSRLQPVPRRLSALAAGLRGMLDSVLGLPPGRFPSLAATICCIAAIASPGARPFSISNSTASRSAMPLASPPAARIPSGTKLRPDLLRQTVARSFPIRRAAVPSETGSERRSGSEPRNSRCRARLNCNSSRARVIATNSSRRSSSKPPRLRGSARAASALLRRQ